MSDWNLSYVRDEKRPLLGWVFLNDVYPQLLHLEAQGISLCNTHLHIEFQYALEYPERRKSVDIHLENSKNVSLEY